jgi:CRP-like cAMP-binding protein
VGKSKSVKEIPVNPQPQPTLLDQINTVALAVNALAKRSPNHPDLAAMAWAAETVAQEAHRPGLRHVLSGSPDEVMARLTDRPAPQPQAPPAPHLTPAEVNILARLDTTLGATVREIMEATGYTRVYVSQRLNNLLALDLVRREGEKTRIPARWWAK